MRSAFLLLLILPACNDRRSFDERYADTQRNLEDRVQNLDAAINSADKQGEPEPRRP